MPPLHPETWTPDQLPRDLGPYRLTGVLGIGGTARVFDAHLIGPQGLTRPVALKVLRRDSTMPRAREMLLREAELASLIRHPNVVDVLDLGELEGLPYIAMERIDGLTLKQVLKDGPLPPLEALDMLQQIAAGLTALHDLRLPGRADDGVVHRDLKPANVLVDRDGRVRLVDFGIAVAADANSQTEAWGTLSYMSPEQATADPVEATSDVFSFGALIYEVLLGQKLWPGTRPSEVIQALLQVEERLHEGTCLREVDAALAGAGPVLRDCLRFDAAQRLRNGSALWEALESLRPRDRTPSGLHQRVQDQLAPQDTDPDAEGGQHPVALVGRDPELSWLAAPGGRLRTLAGPLGVGKSALATVHASRVERSGHSVVLHTALRDALAPSAALQQVAEAVGVSAAALVSVPQGAWALGEALAAHGPCLLVLDDADGCVEPLADWLPAWLTQAPDLEILVTTRRALGAVSEQVLDVPLLDDNAAVALLTRLTDDPPPAAALRRRARRIGGLPLALQLAATAGLTSGTTGPGTDTTGDLPQRVRASLRLAWNGLDLATREVLAACAVFRDGFTLSDAVEVLVAAELDAPGGALALLAERGLLRERPGAGAARLVLDQPLLGFATDRLADEPDRRSRLLDAHAAHYAKLGSEGVVARLSGPRAFEVQSHWVDERANLVVALVRSLEHNRPQRAAHLGRALHNARRLGHPVDELPALTRRLSRLRGVTSADRLRLDLDRGRAMLALGQSALCKDVLRSVEQRAREQDERVVLGQVLVERTRVLIGSARYTQAQALIDEAQDLAEEEGRRGLLARCLRVQAVLLRRARRYTDALVVLQRAGRMCRALADAHLETHVDSLAGLVCLDLGQLDEGVGLLEGVVAVLRTTPDRHGLARQLGNLGLLEARAGHTARARGHLVEGLSLYQRIGALGDATHLHQTLGSIALESGDVDASVTHHLRAVEIVQQLEKRDQLATALVDYGLSLRNLGKLEEARQAMERGRAVAEELGQRERLALADANLAELCFAEGRTADGAALAHDLLDRAEVQADPRLLGCAQGLAGEAARRAGDLATAEPLLDAAVAAMHGRDQTTWRDLCLRRARLWLDQGRLDDVQAVVDEVVAHATAQGMTRMAPLRRSAEHLGREVKRRRSRD